MNEPLLDEKKHAVRATVREGYAKIAKETSQGCCPPGVSCCGSAPADADKLARDLGYMVEHLPAGAKPADFITSLEVQARKSGGDCCGTDCCAA